jgi:hypothetical protein
MAKTSEYDQLIVFNPTDKSQPYTWGGQQHFVPSRQRVILIRYEAEHFAKHLADTILLTMERLHKEAYKKEHGNTKDYEQKSYINDRKLRPKVLGTILLGVYRYSNAQTVDPGEVVRQQLNQANDEFKNATDMGNMQDTSLGSIIQHQFNDGDAGDEAEPLLMQAFGGVDDKPIMPGESDPMVARGPMPLSSEPAQPQVPLPQPLVPAMPNPGVQRPVAPVRPPIPTASQPPAAPEPPLTGLALRNSLIKEAKQLGIKVEPSDTVDMIREKMKAEAA